MSRKLCFHFLFTFLLLTNSLSFAEEEEIEGEIQVEDENEDGEANVLGGGAIHINIQPVTNGEIECWGEADGVKLLENPSDCLHFFLCIQGEGHKVECPRIPDQTYFNPFKKTCASVSETYCQEVDYQEVLDSFVEKEGEDDDEDEGEVNSTLEENVKTEL